jgi:hypothetical protein
MSDMADDALFANEDWSVAGDGLEHRGTGYFIARDTLVTRRPEGLWDWPLQMAEKRWCRPSLFREAFLAALDRYGVERDADLTRSFALGYGIRAAEAPAATGFQSLAQILRPVESAEAAEALNRTPVRALATAG